MIELGNLPPKVFSVEKQRDAVSGVVDFKTYSDLHKKHFEGNRFLDEVVSHTSPDTPSDYFTVLGQTTLISAQYGFPLLDGIMYRHKFKGWEKSAASLPHIVALGQYVADLNVQSYEIKERLSKHAAGDHYFGIWGLMLPIENGKVHRKPYIAIEAADVAATRFRASLPICAPDVEFNEKLAGIDFDGHQADKMPAEEFKRDVLPEVVEIFKKVTPAIPLRGDLGKMAV